MTSTASSARLGDAVVVAGWLVDAYTSSQLRSLVAALLAEKKTTEPDDGLLRFVPISHGLNRAVGCHSARRLRCRPVDPSEVGS